MNIDTGPTETDALAILVSGGLDSAILLAESLSTQRAVQPLYVRCGLYWEDVEMHICGSSSELCQHPGCGRCTFCTCP